MPDRYSAPKPLRVKPGGSGKVKHFTAPLKGLSLSSKLTSGDPLTAPILDNWVIEENSIKCRPGTALTHDFYPTGTRYPIEHLIQYTGSPNVLAAATAGTVKLLSGALVHSGFTSNDWHCTFFSNLGDKDYTVMVNGADGVWSWDGGTTADPAPITTATLSNTNPARVTVAFADIGKFYNGMVVTISAISDSNMQAAAGEHVVSLVNNPANTFTLQGVDCHLGTAPETVTVDIPGSMYKETVTASPNSPYVSPNLFHVVCNHQNRLFFADASNHAFYYLPLQQKGGQVEAYPLNAVFRSGGHIVTMCTWTLDGGAGMDDALVIFTSNGEAVIFSGIDPSSPDTWNMIGIFHFDAPMSKHSVVNYGGDLFVMISTGLVPMSTMMKSESERLGKADQNVLSAFTELTGPYRTAFGWSLTLDHTTGRMICNLPIGSGVGYKQMVRFMPNPIWASWSGIPARCWGWSDNRLYFGSSDGKVYEMSAATQVDAPIDAAGGDRPITVDVQLAWTDFGTPALKHFKMIRTFSKSSGAPVQHVDISVDYNDRQPINTPEVSITGAPAPEWNVARWDEDDGDDGWYWLQPSLRRAGWSGVGTLGTVGAVRLTAPISFCDFAISGFDVIYEPGSLWG
jgi:hypothetical protein